MTTAEEVVSALREHGRTVAVAESLTGGLVCAALVEVPGASVVFRGGVVAYATELKHRLLDVEAALLADSGPVDPAVARQMALGVREHLGADWGLSTTGVAGPDPQGEMAPGRVYVAVAGPLVSGLTEVARPAVGAGSTAAPSEPIGVRVLDLDLAGNRSAVRSAATAEALGALLAALREVTLAAPTGGQRQEARARSHGVTTEHAHPMER